jgi:hypothetical protein
MGLHDSAESAIGRSMKKIVWLLFLLSSSAFASTAALSNYCVLGASQANTSGLKSSNYLQGVIPSCTVTVYLTGTTTLATIYSDSSSTALTNPFTANTDGSWLLFAEVNQGYDVEMSGGISPNTYPSPVTLTGLYPATQIINPSGNYLPLSGGTLTGDLITRNVYAVTGSTYDLGKTGFSYNNAWINTAHIGVLADGATATTQTQGDGTTKVATDAYVDTGLALKLNANSIVDSAHGGTGVASPTGYAYGNGSGVFTFSSTIPYSALAGTVPTWNQSTTGNAATASALAATPTLCATGYAPTGIEANGNATGCVALAAGSVTDGSGTTTAGLLAQSTGTAHVISYSSSLPSGTTATTQAQGSNSTSVATTAYADAAGASSKRVVCGGVSDNAALQAALNGAGNITVTGNCLLSSHMTILSGTVLSSYGATYTYAPTSADYILENYAATESAQRTFTDGVLSALSTTITSASASFTSADVGNSIACTHGNGPSTDLHTSIVSITNSTTAVLTDFANRSVNPATCSIYVRDHDIAILGGTFIMKGSLTPAQSQDAIRIRTANRVRLQDVTTDETSGAGFWQTFLNDIDNFTVESQVVSSITSFQDGLHIGGPAHYGVINGVSCLTGDDCVAIDDGDANTIQAPLIDTAMYGALSNIDVSNVSGSGNSHGVLLYSYDYNFASPITQISISHIRSTDALGTGFKLGGVSIWAGATATPYADQIVVSDVVNPVTPLTISMKIVHLTGYNAGVPHYTAGYSVSSILYPTFFNNLGSAPSAGKQYLAVDEFGAVVNTGLPVTSATLVNHTIGSSNGAVTTQAVSMSGATLLVATVAKTNSDCVDGALTDSLGNTYTKLTNYSVSYEHACTYYVCGATVGSAMTFTLNAAATLTVSGWSSSTLSSCLDVATGATSSSATSLNTGAVTTTTAGDICIAGATHNNYTTLYTSQFAAPLQAFSMIDSVNASAGLWLNGADGYHIQPSAGNISTTYTVNNGVAAPMIATLQCFKP